MKRPIVKLTILLAVILCGSPVLAREWTDRSGQFSVEAELVRIEGDNVVLRKTDGTTVSVPVAELSSADRRHVDVEKARWNLRIAGRILRDFPEGDIGKGEVALVVEKGMLGYVFTKDLAEPPKGQLYSLRTIGRSSVDDYFQPRRRPKNSRTVAWWANLGGFGSGRSFMLLLADGNQLTGDVRIDRDGSVLCSQRNGPLRPGQVQAIFPFSITDSRPQFHAVFGGRTTSIPFFSAVYNETKQNFDYFASAEPVREPRTYNAKQGITAGLLFCNGHPVGGYDHRDTLRRLRGALLLDVLPDGCVIYRQGMTYYPTYMDWPMGERQIRHTVPFVCAPGIVTYLQLFDTMWYFDAERRAFLYDPQKDKPFTGRGLARFKADDNEKMRDFVAQLADKVGSPGLTWDDLDRQEKLEICKSYLHLRRGDAERGKVLLSAMVIAGLATSAAPAAAGAANDVIGRATTSTPRSTSTGSSKAYPLRITFAGPNQPSPGEIVTYDLDGEGDTLTSPRVESAGLLSLPLKRSGHDRVRFLLKNVWGPWKTLDYKPLQNKYDDLTYP